jgi:cell division protein FtsZ
MQDIVKSALEHEEDERERRDAATDGPSDDDFGEPRIVVVGCGGAGNNTVNRLHSINTDKQHLKMIEADTKILVGKSLTEGLGAGGDPEKGARATEMAQNTIDNVLGDADLVFVTAGMGGGTGTGAAPVVANIAKEQGAIVVGMVSTPFNVERARKERAQEGLQKLEEEADSIIVLDNNRLLDYVPNLPIGKAFSVMDSIIAETVKGISETITQPSLINLDYADMTAIMSKGGVAVMLVGETQDANKSDEVVKDALDHPLLDVDYRGATGGLVHITGGPDLTLKEAENTAQKITERLESSANVIWGARIREDYKGKIRVMAIMTGIDGENVMSDSAPSISASNPSGQTAAAEGGLGDVGLDTDDDDDDFDDGIPVARK